MGADGFANWQAGWSVPKKEWCCRVHGKGCANQGGGCVTSSEPYDCNAGFANWMAGWSIPKKSWSAQTRARAVPQQPAGARRDVQDFHGGGAGAWHHLLVLLAGALREPSWSN